MVAASTLEFASAPVKRRDRWTSWAVAVLAATFFVTVCRPIIPYARQHDFLSFYTGASLVYDGRPAQLYDREIQTARERGLAPGLPVIAPYIRPPVYAAILSPLAML